MKRTLLAVLVLAGCAADPPRQRPAADADRLSAAGSQAYADGDYRVAAARFSAAIDAARAIDDRGRQARELHNRGMALLGAGAAAGAVDDLGAALRLSQDAPAMDRAATRLALAQALAALGRNQEALAEADRAGNEVGDQPGLQARIHASAAVIALAIGDLPGAAQRLVGIHDDGGAVDHARGLVALASGDRMTAEAAFQRAIAACQAVGDLPGLAAALTGFARSAEAGGDRAEAARRWRRAAGVPFGGEARQQACLAEAAKNER